VIIILLYLSCRGCVCCTTKYLSVRSDMVSVGGDGLIVRCLEVIYRISWSKLTKNQISAIFNV
jgi:hypothetical protein